MHTPAYTYRPITPGTFVRFLLCVRCTSELLLFLTRDLVSFEGHLYLYQFTHTPSRPRPQTANKQQQPSTRHTRHPSDHLHDEAHAHTDQSVTSRAVQGTVTNAINTYNMEINHAITYLGNFVNARKICKFC